MVVKKACSWKQSVHVRDSCRCCCIG